MLISELERKVILKTFKRRVHDVETSNKLLIDCSESMNPSGKRRAMKKSWMMRNVRIELYIFFGRAYELFSPSSSLVIKSQSGGFHETKRASHARKTRKNDAELLINNKWTFDWSANKTQRVLRRQNEKPNCCWFRERHRWWQRKCVSKRDVSIRGVVMSNL